MFPGHMVYCGANRSVVALSPLHGKLYIILLIMFRWGMTQIGESRRFWGWETFDIMNTAMWPAWTHYSSYQCKKSTYFEAEACAQY